MKKHLILIAFALGLPSVGLAKEKLRFNLEHEHVPGQLIVGFKADVPEELRSLVLKRIDGFKTSSQFEANAGQTVLIESRNLASSKEDLGKFAAYIESLPGVRFVEANSVFRLSEQIPNDPQFSNLYGLKNPSSTDGVRKDIGATFAWQKSTGSKDVLVGVIDTGIDYQHEDLAENYWTNPGETGLDDNGEDKQTNGVDDDNNGYVDDWRGWDFANNDNDPMDDHSHGTHCAGTIGAKGNNGVGVVGVNWDVSLVGIKIFSAGGSTSVDAIVAGIDYATSIGVDLTSNSWGGGSPSQAIREAIERANSKGILFVAAAGNSSSDNDSVGNYPSNYPIDNIIAVASTDRNDNLSSFSSYGLESVDVAAPGSNIYSTIPNNGYGYKSGTSMATPHVAGLVALIKSRFPDADYLDHKNRVLTTASRVPSVINFVKYGRINADASMEIDEIAPSTPLALNVDGVGLKSLNLSWAASGDDGSAGKASSYEVKISDEPITEENWAELNSASFIPLASDSQDKVMVQLKGLSFEQTGYVAVKAIDNVGNKSALSDNQNFSLPKVQITYHNQGDIDDGITEVTGTWGSSKEDGKMFLSDSPESIYTDNMDASVTTEAVKVTNDDMVLELETRYFLEKGYDFGSIEISTDGGKTWRLVANYTGTQSWTSLDYPLQGFLTGASEFMLKFTTKSDQSITDQGWDIASIKIIVPAVSE